MSPSEVTPPADSGSATDAFLATFREETGYLDFGRVGPVSSTVEAEQAAVTGMLARARSGSLDELFRQDERMREAVAALVRVPADHVVFQPNTSTGLLHTLFGASGDVLLSAAEFPSLPFAAVRAGQALGAVQPRWLRTQQGRVTPEAVREQLSDEVTAVAVSLVDSRTGYLADVEAIRDVIGDRLLILDAIQGFGVVDAPYEFADVVVSGGQKWLRAGWGTGFLALSERALARLSPVLSGWTGSQEAEPWDAVAPPRHDARAFSVSNPDPIAQARLAAALEDVASVGVPTIAALVAERVSAIVDLADEFGLAVAGSRDDHERAGIVVLEPEPEELAPLVASLTAHGVTARLRPSTVRFSAHAGTTDETLALLRAALISAATSIEY
ncbi:aminotransferase class V-fold PLP-dependent enzyme [Rathayibacter tanaceti]|uniref:Aminotransferase class V-fold PLP-dependent enzyme n=2 Tax=Rathayibacter tanaceti TaxID=1671680 RepID=A0A162GKK9_9MICO|nr:aminotransferase class V-fold PLP-dependent enzyme [Rathayibacter tanaceti]KZX22749.1 phosphoserine aminotransferase [Rathayibacter tanaceti]QHC55933.1 aminotransferase class V-fold PLP-dependent enzyme [Rathayibacter tanaceti]TCO39229.1 selenocysteine lyase/cysteine desulfurase [Rathayibacter tanaceti]